jgi:hypothetical protein
MKKNNSFKLDKYMSGVVSQALDRLVYSRIARKNTVVLKEYELNELVEDKSNNALDNIRKGVELYRKEKHFHGLIFVKIESQDLDEKGRDVMIFTEFEEDMDPMFMDDFSKALYRCFGAVKELVIDEKAVISLLYRKHVNFNSRCFELRSSTVDENNIGWLREENDTDIYTFVLPKAVKGKFTQDKIKKVNIWFLAKKDILFFLEQNGYDLETLDRVCDAYTKGDTSFFPSKKDEAVDGFYFSRSYRLKNKPINVVIRDDVLDMLCIYKVEALKSRFTVEFQYDL